MAGAARFTLSDLLEANAEIRGAELALRFKDKSHSFASLDQRARSLAAAFAQAGLRHQDRVAILAKNCIEYCEAYAACERGGFIAVTVNFRLTAAEIYHILHDSGARIVIFEAAFAEVLAGLRDQLAAVETFFCIGESLTWADDFGSVGSGAPCPIAQPDDIAFLIYTSGTTGKPKGCIIGQAEEIEKARISAADTRMSSQDRILLCMPLFHIGAKAMLTSQHWVGGAAFIHEGFHPPDVLRAIERDRITVLHLAPTMVKMLLEQTGIEDYDLSSLRAIIYSASSMPLAVLQRGIALLGPIFYQIYGLTEGVGTILGPQFHRVDGREIDTKRLKSIGVPSPGVRLRIADDAGREMPQGQAGEILLKTPAMAKGYWNNHAATISAFRDGWLHTGDIGFIDDDGFIYLVDRKKDMIITGGENVYSREVEDALYQHTAISEAAVIGVPDDKWGESVRAVVVLRLGMNADAEDIIFHVSQLIARYKKPKDIVFVDELPKLASGKIDKQTIRKRYGVA